MTAACETCRSLKMRCSRSGASQGDPATKEPCDRCRRHNRACKDPPSRPAGRKPGSLGRYRGVEKAIRKIQTELRKSKLSPSSSSPNRPDVQEILDLTDGKEEILGLLLSRGSTQTQELVAPSHASEEIAQTSRLPPANSIFRDELYQNLEPICQSPTDRDSPHGSNITVSNPLGLVADACGEVQGLDEPSNSALSLLSPSPERINLSAASSQETGPYSFARRLLRRPGYVSLGLKLDRNTLEDGLDALLHKKIEINQYLDYFKPSDMKEGRDTGPDFDPVDLGLVSMEEAHYLFPFFFEHLHPINGILDPMLHTPEFVRSRSALLFTWILAISAQFNHTSGLISKRLRIHGENLSRKVHANGYKSVEIAQGYYISLLSAVPANSMAEERSWLYTIYAFGVAAELGLDREARPQESLPSIVRAKNPTTSAVRSHPDCESSTPNDAPRQDAEADHTEDPTYAKRLARNRERTWLRILLWERAHSAARGRMSAFPETELTLNIETWYLHSLADPNDKYTCAFVLLRRHLTTLHDELKRQIGFQHTSRHWVRELLDSTLQPWCCTWMETSDGLLSPAERISNTFMQFVYMHGRLWTLSFALHGHTSGALNVDAIEEDCFEAAVNCCETAVQKLQEIGEPLYCMLAPTWAMISYAAVLALKLFALLYGTQSGKEVELLSLLAQVALQLERAGTTPSHRFGMAALLGQHLFMLLRSRAGVSMRLAQDSQTRGSVVAETNFDGDLDQGYCLPDMQSLDPFLSDFDPFLTSPFIPGETDGSAAIFSEALWDWAGQGFGSIT